ncbi:MAG: L,D-transpeptidase family protein [Verrucomicrobiaceae bacterium]
MKSISCIILAVLTFTAVLPLSASAANPKPKTYVVKKGDTLSRIARIHGCHWKELVRLNKLKSEIIAIGLELRLPGASTPPQDPNITTIKINSKQDPATLNKQVLAKATSQNTSIIVDLSRQRAFLLVDGAVAINTPVSTGKAGNSTPKGMFKITERVETGKTSNKYDDAPMPYWMRLGTSPIGLHIGHLPGSPASHGCIRLPKSIAPLIFANTKSGTPVSIQDQWEAPTPRPPVMLVNQ